MNSDLEYIRQIALANKYSLLAVALSIPVGVRLPPRHRYTPLLVLGVSGSLADFFAGQATSENGKHDDSPRRP